MNSVRMEPAPSPVQVNTIDSPTTPTQNGAPIESLAVQVHKNHNPRLIQQRGSTPRTVPQLDEPTPTPPAPSLDLLARRAAALRTCRRSTRAHRPRWLPRIRLHPRDRPCRRAFQEFTVSAPPDTPPGQYITGLAIETTESRPIAGNWLLRQSTRLVTAVFITVPGPITPGFEMSDLAIDVDPFGTSLTGTITNTGNVRVRPEGSFILFHEQGRTVAHIPIKIRSIYAHDVTTFVVALPTPLPEGSYLASGNLVDADTRTSATLDGV
jgi:hypothetical protein